jgi:hypothetical protein
MLKLLSVLSGADRFAGEGGGVAGPGAEEGTMGLGLVYPRGFISENELEPNPLACVFTCT